MFRRAFFVLLGTLGLAACGSPDSGSPTAINQPPPRFGTAPASGVSGPVAILLPLSGKLAEIGKPMLKAAQLSLSVPGSPVLIIKDTGGTPGGAAQGARDAITEGARIILGPVTAAETAQVAPIALRAGIPVLAFTNDHAQAQPGIWTLGITPGQQVRRLVEAVRQANHGPIVALLPDNDFGKAMGDELTRIAAAEGQPPPFIRMHGPGEDSVTGAVQELAAMMVPGQPLPFGAILLGTTGNDLKLMASAMGEAGIDRSKIQILGPGLWIDPASGSAAMVGAWVAVPDPDARRDMVKEYAAKFKEYPQPRSDLAHDAASIARVLASQGRMNFSGLTQPAGFTGVDGWLSLMADGQVRRGLALFRVDRGRVTKIGPAATGPAG